MPIYEYKCEKTGNIYEVKQGINDLPLTHCTLENCECKGTSKVHRIISKNIGLVFNGSGFYQTDYVHTHTSFPGGNRIKHEHPDNRECCKANNICSNSDK